MKVKRTGEIYERAGARTAAGRPVTDHRHEPFRWVIACANFEGAMGAYLILLAFSIRTATPRSVAEPLVQTK
jgi:hypothetical protein